MRNLLLPFLISVLLLNGFGLWRALDLWEQHLHTMEVTIADESELPLIPDESLQIPAPEQASPPQEAAPRLALQELFCEAWDRKGKVSLRLSFTAPVDVLRVEEHVQLRDREGSRLKLRLSETPNPAELMIQSEVGKGGPLQLSLLQGLPSTSDKAQPLAGTESYSIKLPEGFVLSGRDVHQPSFGPGYIDLSFNAAPDLQRAAAAIRVEPAVKLQVGKVGWWRRNALRVQGDFVPGQRYTLHLGEGLRSLAGEALPEALAIELHMPPRKPGLEFSDPGGWMLNASGAGQIRMRTRNEGSLDMSLRRVHENNLLVSLLRKAGRDGYYHRDASSGLDQAAWSEKREILEEGEQQLDLSGPLQSLPQGLYHLEVQGGNSEQLQSRLILLSDVALLARRHGDELLVWASDVDTGLGLEALSVQVWSSNRQLLAEGLTDADGVARLRLAPADEGESPFAVIARSQDRLGLLSLDRIQAGPEHQARRDYVQQGYEAFLYTARGMFRPGEELQARAILRHAAAPPKARFPLQWHLLGPGALELWTAAGELSDLGTSELRLPLQKSWPSGAYRLELRLPGASEALGSCSFRVESFVPPQLKVDLESEDGKAFGTAPFRVKGLARHLYGAPAADHRFDAMLMVQPELFRSSEHPEFQFSDVRKSRFRQKTLSLGKKLTTAEGKISFPVSLPPYEVPSALRATVRVSVKEFSGRVASAEMSRRVDLFPWYAGLKLQAAGEGGLQAELLALLPDGSLMEEARTLRWGCEQLERESGYRRDPRGHFVWRSDTVAIPLEKGEVELAAGRASLSLDLAPGKRYRVWVEDPESGVSAARDLWLGSAEAAPERADRIDLEVVEGRTAPGETIRIRGQLPFPGRLLLSVEDTELRWHQVLVAEEKHFEVELTLPETRHPNSWFRALLLRPLPRDGALPLMQAEGLLALKGHHEQLQELELEIAEELKPGRTHEVLIRGEPGAELLLTVVDEAILMLDRFPVPDALAVLNALRRPMSLSWNSYRDWMPELAAKRHAGEAAMGGGLGMMMGNRLNPVDAKRFRPLAWWSGAQRIPESGELRLQVPIPEFSGAVRWHALQVSAAGMGSASQQSRVARELLLQQSLPLALSPGDQSQWTIRLHNRSEERKTLSLGLHIEGDLKLDAPLRHELELAAKEQRLLSFPVEAGEGLGLIRVRAEMELAGERWQEEMEVALRPLQPWQQRMHRKLLRPGERWSPPQGWPLFPGTAEAKLQVSALPSLQGLTAANQVLRYPYGCVEQVSSAGTAALFLQELGGEWQAGAELRLSQAVVELWAKQKRNGAFGYWHSQDELHVQGSFIALRFLLEAQEAGLALDSDRLEAGLRWARRYLNRNLGSTQGPSRRERILAAQVLARAGELDAGWAQRLLEWKGRMDHGERILAADALVEAGRRPQALLMLEGLTQIPEGSGWYAGSRLQAEFLYVLLRCNPEDPRIPAALVTLMDAASHQGGWRNTLSTASALRALQLASELLPLAEGRLELQQGSQLHAFDADQILDVPVAPFENRGEQPLYVEYVESGIPLHPVPVASTFAVDVKYLGMDGQAPEQGFRSGELVLCEVELRDLPRVSEYMAVDLRLPAGLEPLGSEAQSRLRDFVQFTLPRSMPLRHLELRDDRVLLFPKALREGRAFVLLRAVTPGRYILPKPRAEDMYDPDLMAEGEGGVLSVEAGP